ncbi:MAG: MTH1187 family thiamine-binding protein [Eubacterium sp.]
MNVLSTDLLRWCFFLDLSRNTGKEDMRMKASVAIQVLPEVKGDENELIRIVDEVIAYIKSTGLNCYVGPFETTIEGESYDELMEIVANCQKVAIKAGCASVSAYIKVVYNPEGEVLTIDKKVTKHHQ